MDMNKSVAHINLSNYIIEQEALNSIPEELARKHKMIPLFRVRDTLTVAISDVSDIVGLDAAKLASGCDIQSLGADESAILMLIDQNYNIGNSFEDVLKKIEGMKADFLKGNDFDQGRVQKIVEEPQIIKIVNLIIFQALKEKASDIHIEPEADKIRIRLRIDGVLHESNVFPAEVLLPIVSRIKVLSKLDIVEMRKPQDGHFSIKLGDRELDIRVSTFPVTFGEKVEMRILDRSSVYRSFEKLGCSEEQSLGLRSVIERPYGIILVTGPTGSGKTSTLYTILCNINAREKNIVTLEDPREYILEGINQAEVNPVIGFTFATGLRTILRQDPDVIMIGETRDAETAQISIRAALTGHLVLSSLHTNDSTGAITRLLDMGVEPFLLSATINAVLAQRLVRKICPACKEEFEASDEIKEMLGLSDKNILRLARGKGCIQCHHTGYHGRVGIFELLLISDNLRELIVKDQPAEAILKEARNSGMKTLREDGFRKVIDKVTTMEEVLRVCL